MGCGNFLYSFFRPWVEEDVGEGGRDSNEEEFVLEDGGEIQASPHS